MALLFCYTHISPKQRQFICGRPWISNSFMLLSAHELTTYIKVANALDYAKAATLVANKDLTLLANFVKMFPFNFLLLFNA